MDSTASVWYSADSSEKVYQIALSKVPGVGCKLFQGLIKSFSSAKDIFRASPRRLSDSFGLTNSIIQSILKEELIADAQASLKQHTKAGIKIILHKDPAYPDALRHIQTPPSLLYYRGNSALLNSKRIVSVVGTRTATAYGKKALYKLIGELSAYEVTIASGLAAGIDVCAHKAAMLNNLPTIAVMAGGLDRIYPAYHTPVVYDILKHGGGVLSEYALEKKPELHHFPARNRIIAGVASATVVIEAGKKSGALITARLANDYDREVFALPGDVGKSYSEGCNNLIKNHQAHLVTDAADIAYMMNWDKPASKEDTKATIVEPLKQLSQEEQRAYSVFTQLREEMHIDEVCSAMRMPYEKASTIMVQLALKNVIEALPGGSYKLKVA